MKQTKTAPWLLGAALVSLMVLAATWFLGVSPRLEAKAEMEQEAEAATSQIDTLEIQLAQLKKDFANIDSFRADLAALRTQVPETLNESDLARQLDLLATQTGVTVLGLNPTTPVPMDTAQAAAAEVPAATTEPTTDGAVADPAAAGTAAADGTQTEVADQAPAAAAPVVQGVWAVPMEIQVLGSYEQTLAFVDALQVANPRLILVTSVSIVAKEEAGASDGMPAVQAGWVETMLKAYMYVVQPSSGLTAIDVEDQPVTELPVPAGQPNPFYPTS